MKFLASFLATCIVATLASSAESFAGGGFAPGGGSVITDLAARPDGSIVVCGMLGETAKAPAAEKSYKLLDGEHGTGKRAFVAQFSADLGTIDWFSVFPADSIAPSRVAIAPDGSVALGGKHLGGLEGQDACHGDWKKSGAALAKVDAGGVGVIWAAPAGPNQDGITGLDVGADGHIYFAGGSSQRQAANYLLRKNGKTGENEGWGETGWCVYLHTNQEALKAEGQYFGFYDKAKDESEEGHGYDYDGEGGWGPVGFSLQGFRIGGDVVVLPGGDIVVSSCLQYDFRVAERTADGIKKGKGFPAFDYFLARYSKDGALRWSTNLYQPGDSVHTPDQKPADLAYDAKSDSLYVLAKQHGSNQYRFKGDLVGDTGNLMISWVGKVEAKSGALQDGWYFQNNRTGEFQENGVPKSPPYPKLAGNSLNRIALGAEGEVYVAGVGGAQTWTSEGAPQSWPGGQSGGGEGALLQLSPSLDKIDYATCLFTDAGETFAVNGLAVTEKGIILAGSGQWSGALAEKSKAAPWSQAGEGEACLVFAILR